MQPLLGNATALRALGCLCLEVLLSARQTAMTDMHNADGPHSVAFPWVLRSVKVAAFDFWKVREAHRRLLCNKCRFPLFQYRCRRLNIVLTLIVFLLLSAQHCLTAG